MMSLLRTLPVAIFALAFLLAPVFALGVAGCAAWYLEPHSFQTQFYPHLTSRNFSALSGWMQFATWKYIGKREHYHAVQLYYKLSSPPVFLSAHIEELDFEGEIVIVARNSR